MNRDINIKTLPSSKEIYNCLCKKGLNDCSFSKNEVDTDYNHMQNFYITIGNEYEKRILSFVLRIEKINAYFYDTIKVIL